ncbi:transcriptional regulator [Acetobacter nitrogenifigens DSM 23921 = NBRC 105050]|uniref:Homoprotocatechuate degradation operon regulator, HpaR n=3 Tax=Acetobacter nitrogenifigens TaxID=285268 RepID=A0A511XED6_9PROT|nr:transcriptional regulator [Acetobacter nitrogenifigens DSM 23921 = NBRC 105050]GEN61318.1 homoprotocatechuate degradation operon regulator, HpaR [Acetobacter nitrogenifigens DSM 23921 = NBRC 105050]
MPPLKRPSAPRDTKSPASNPASELPHEATKAMPIALLRAREALMSRFRPMLAEHDFTSQQWRVIRLLNEHSTLDAAQLAEKAFILPPSLTRILANLETRDLVTRVQSSSDRRRYLFTLTAPGEEAFRKISPDRIKVYKEIEAYFGKEKINLLLGLLDELAQF